jgi:hypothetical protein
MIDVSFWELASAPLTSEMRREAGLSAMTINLG